MAELESYLRTDRLPFIWCPGCGNGIAVRAVLGAVDRLGLPKDRVAVVSGIGCSSRASGYLDFCTLHTTHGRAIAFATGMKLARPSLTVIVLTGDGDALAIGGNHFIHAARRNVDITVVLFNNCIYGMTGGQVSPTTPLGARSATSRLGNLEPPFDAARLAAAAGASFVARVPVTKPFQLSRYIEMGIRKRGFALIEALTPCPTAFGRQNKLATPIENMRWIEEISIEASRASQLGEGALGGRVVTGVLVDAERPEYVASYEAAAEASRAEGLRVGLPAREVVRAAECLERGEVV